MFPIRDSFGWTRTPVIVFLIIGVCTGVYLYQVSLPGRAEQAFVYTWGLVPRRYFDPTYAYRIGLSPLDFSPFLTNAFMHGGLLHIVLNLWTLYIFGPALEQRLGSLRFLVLYLSAAVIASAAHAFFNPLSNVPALGASGAIAGVIAAYAVRFPFAQVRVLVPIIIIPFFFHIPALFFAGIWFLLQVVQGLQSFALPTLGGIAWWAHIGGFLAGLVLVHALDPGRGPFRDRVPDVGPRWRGAQRWTRAQSPWQRPDAWS